MRSAKPSRFFSRPSETFAPDPRLAGWILADPANPLHQIVHMISSGTTVLDVGAGNGILANLLAAIGKKVAIDAVEPNTDAQKLAAPHYGSLFAGGLEEYLRTPVEKKYSYIVMADVLEHIAYPESLLENLKERLVHDGLLLVSIPNVAFANIRFKLLNGEFRYTDSGILERTHLRFYTQETLYSLFNAVGWYPQRQIDCLRDPMTSSPQLMESPFSPCCFAKACKDPLANIFHFVMALSPKPTHTPTHTCVGAKKRYAALRYISRYLFHTCRKAMGKS